MTILDLAKGLCSRVSGRIGGQVIRNLPTGQVILAARQIHMGHEADHPKILWSQRAWNQLENLWHKLTPEQRIEWGRCTTGKGHPHVTNFVHFKRINLTRMWAGFPALVSPPDAFRSAQPQLDLVTGPWTAIDDTYSTPNCTTLNVSAPGVMANDLPPGPCPVCPPSRPPLSRVWSSGFDKGGHSFDEDDAPPPVPPGPIDDDQIPPTPLECYVSDDPWVTLIDNVSEGLLSLDSDGSFTYVPNCQPCTLYDSFSYAIHNRSGLSTQATVSLTIDPIPPVAWTDQYDIVPHFRFFDVESSVLDNDIWDCPGSLTAELVTPPTQGTLTLYPTGIFSYHGAWKYDHRITWWYRAVGDGVPGNTVAVNMDVHCCDCGGDPMPCPLDTYLTNISYPYECFDCIQGCHVLPRKERDVWQWRQFYYGFHEFELHIEQIPIGDTYMYLLTGGCALWGGPGEPRIYASGFSARRFSDNSKPEGSYTIITNGSTCYGGSFPPPPPDTYTMNVGIPTPDRECP